jgi:acetyl esterase
MKSLIRWLARAMLNRPPAALIKSSGGVARTVGGRTLDPRFQFLEAQARKRPAPDPFDQHAGRAGVDDLVFMVGGKPEAGVLWEQISIPADGRNIPARLYRPAKQDAAAAMMVYYHFGGGVVGNLETCHAFCTILANAMAAPVLSVDYRLAPEHRWPAGLEDAIHAYVWSLANAARFGAPNGRASVGGDSMGGNFSAIIAQEMKRRGGTLPVLQLLIYPATDLTAQGGSMRDFADAFPLTADTMAWFMSQYLPPGADLRDPLLSPAAEDDLRGLPPTLVYTAGFDPLSDQGADYAKRLAGADVSVRFHCFDSLAHGFTAFTGGVPAADAACRMIASETAAALSGAKVKA